MATFRTLTSWQWRLYRLRARWRIWKGIDPDLNRRATVEIRLWDTVSGKKPPPDADECRNLALKLGVPDEYRQANAPEPRDQPRAGCHPGTHPPRKK